MGGGGRCLGQVSRAAGRQGRCAHGMGRVLPAGPMRRLARGGAVTHGHQERPERPPAVPGAPTAPPVPPSEPGPSWAVGGGVGGAAPGPGGGCGARLPASPAPRELGGPRRSRPVEPGGPALPTLPQWGVWRAGAFWGPTAAPLSVLAGSRPGLGSCVAGRPRVPGATLSAAHPNGRPPEGSLFSWFWGPDRTLEGSPGCAPAGGSGGSFQPLAAPRGRAGAGITPPSTSVVGTPSAPLPRGPRAASRVTPRILI